MSFYNSAHTLNHFLWIHLPLTTHQDLFATIVEQASDWSLLQLSLAYPTLYSTFFTLLNYNKNESNTDYIQEEEEEGIGVNKDK